MRAKYRFVGYVNGHAVFKQVSTGKCCCAHGTVNASCDVSSESDGSMDPFRNNTCMQFGYTRFSLVDNFKNFSS